MLRIRKRSASHRRGEQRRGQAMVEMAVAISMFFVVMCSIYEFGWALYNYSYLSYVVQRVTREGLVGDTNAMMITTAAAANAGLTITITSSDIAVTTPAGQTVANGDRTAGNFLSVTGRMTYTSLTPLSRLIIIAGFGTLSVTAVGRIE